jgi:opacity protein-like surface antigen
MKKLLLVISFILAFGAIFGQGENTAMFKLRGGVSLPFGSFGKNNGGLNYSNFVSSGSNFGVEGVYFYSENVGFGGLLSYSTFKIDNERMAGAFINSNINYDTAFINVNPFRTMVGVVGLYVDLPVSDYFAITLKMLVGSHIVQKPEGIVTVENTVSTNIKFVETSALDSQFALYTSAGMRINPYDNWNVTIEAEYVGSKMEFEFEKNGVSARSSNAIKTLVFSFGIAYFLE